MSQQPDQSPTDARPDAHPTPDADNAEAMTMNDYASLTWDRQPDPDSDTRFHALRDTGHTGFIDQHGYAIPDESSTRDRVDPAQLAAERHDVLRQVRQNILDQADRESAAYLAEHTGDTDEDIL